MSRDALHDVGRKRSILHKTPIHLLVIVVLGLLAYSNTFSSPFQWDEAIFIVENPIVRDLSFFKDPSLAKGLPVYDGFKSRYIGYLTFALNYKIHGLDVFGYHVVNLIIHLINAALVYLLVILTFRTPFFNWQRSSVSPEQKENTPLNPLFPMGEEKGGARPFHYSHFIALATALLFVSHPVQTEAVTYIFQRLASLVSMFYLLSLVLYVKGRLGVMGYEQWVTPLNPPLARGELKGGVSPLTSRLGPLAWFFFSFISAVLAMKTKENAFTLPLAIALYEFLFFSGPLKPRVLRLVPFLLTMAIVPLTIMGTGSTPGEIISQVKDPVSEGHITPAPGDYFLTQFRVIVTYLRLFILPVNQNIDYDYPLYQSFFEAPVVLSFLFLAAVFSAAVYLLFISRQRGDGRRQKAEGKRQSEGDGLPGYPPVSPLENGGMEGGSFVMSHLPYASYYRLIGFGIVWFFLTLSVESSIIPIPMLIDEYRMYLPSVGFFLAVVTGVLLLVRKFTDASPGKLRAAAAAGALVIMAFATATYARNTVWKDPISLWEDVVRKSPESPRGYSNLGKAYHEKGLYDKAIEMYERCLALKPLHPQATMNLGIAYAVTGRPDVAIDYFIRAIAIKPDNNVAYMNLGRAYSQIGRPDKAVENYQAAVGLNPYDSGAYHGMGTAYVKMGLYDEAIKAYTRFAELSPNNPEAYRNRGNVHVYKGDFVSAGADYRKACSLGSSESCSYLERPPFR